MKPDRDPLAPHQIYLAPVLGLCVPERVERGIRNHPEPSRLRISNYFCLGTYQEAERLIVAYRRRRFRTLDALQLAVALDLSRRGMTEYFICADTRLCETAQEEGLLIINPIQP